MKRINLIFLMMIGIFSYAQNTEQVVLDPMNITCPLLPLSVSGNFINPANHELQSLTLHMINSDTGDEEATLDQYTLFGNEFRFNVTEANLFVAGAFKQFYFSVTATFKLIGGTATIDVESLNDNTDPDIIFTEECHVCNSCVPLAQPKTHWLTGFDKYNMNNNIITYRDIYGVKRWRNISYYDCIGLVVTEIFPYPQTKNVGPCQQP